MSENEIYLSFKRIKSNFIKKIWILIIAIIIGIAAIFVNALYSYKKTAKSSEAVVNSNQMYEADVYLQISKNSNEEDSGIDEIAKQLAALIDATFVREKVNNNLEQNQLVKLNANDSINSTLITDTMVLISVYSSGTAHRTENIANVIAETLTDFANETYGNDVCAILEDAESYTVVKNTNGTYKKTYGTSQNQINETLVNNSDNNITIKDITNKKNILLFVICIFIGIFIIIICSIFDDRIYVSNDISGIRFLGNVSDKECDLTAASVTVGMSIYEMVAIVLPMECYNEDKLDRFYSFIKNKITGCGIKKIIGIEENAQNVLELEGVKGVVLYVTSGYDSRKQIMKAVRRIEVAGSNVLGFVLDE